MESLAISDEEGRVGQPLMLRLTPVAGVFVD